MHKNFKHLIRIAEACFALFSVLLLVLSCCALFVFWKLSHGPVDMTWAQSYIQNALGGNKSGIDVKAEGIVAEWKSFDAPLTLGIANLTIRENGAEILSVSQTGLRIARWPLLFGIVSPEAIVIKKPSIRLEKNADGKISFLIANRQAEAAPGSNLNPEELAESLFLGGFLTDNTRLPLTKLESVIIEDANIMIDDKSQGRAFALPGANLTLLRDTDHVDMVMDYAGKAGGLSKINIAMIRNRLAREIKFTLKLNNVETGLWALTLPRLPGLMKEDYSFNGQITGLFNLKWDLTKIDGQIATGMNGHDRQNFSIAATRDPKTGLIPLKLFLAEISLDQVASIWPPELAHLHVTEWFTKKLSKGSIKNFDMSIPFKNINGQWHVAGFVKGSLDFENLTCDYRAPLYPLTQGYGHVTVDNDMMTIAIDKAKLDDLDVQSGTITITKLTSDDPGMAEVKLHLTGPLSTSFRYIALEPISLGDKVKTDPAKVEGQQDSHVTVMFPTLHDLPADQVVAVIDSTLTDTKLPGIAHGLTLSGGPLKLKVEKGAFTISGTGRLEDAPIDFTYSECLKADGAPYIADLKAKLVTDDSLRKKLGIDVADYISGKAGIDMAYQEKTNGLTEIGVKADLTQARTFVKPLNYLKKEGVPGSATATLVLKGSSIEKISDLTMTSGKDSISGGRLTFGMLGKEHNVTAATLDKVKLGAANDASIEVEQTAALLKVKVSGASLDARAILGDQLVDTTPRSRDVEMNVRVDTMRMGDKPEQVLKSAVMRVVANPAGEVKFMDLDAKTGQGNLAVNIAPDTRGVMGLKISSDNAGDTLRAVGAYENLIGGTLVLSGSQMPGGRINDMQGTAEIGAFRVVKAPALAKLIGAFSITGLPELLANDGISFTKLKSGFVWRKTQNGSRIINLYDGATSGGSVGLTFGGIINQTKDTVDLSGTFVPVSQINKIVSAIPIVGKLLTGGKNGGVIAATYSLKGPSNNPSVAINPLSVLAPGFLRSILFEGGMGAGRDEKPIVPRKANIK